MKVKYTYDDVKNIFEKRGYKLLSNNYEKLMDILEYTCPNGHKGSIIFKNFNRGSNCRKCAIKKPKEKRKKCKKRQYYTIEFIKQIFEKYGYIVHTINYNCREKIEYTCPNGHRDSIFFYPFYVTGNRCNQCKYITNGNNKKLDFTEIKDLFENSGFKLLTKEYLGIHEPLKFICPSGHETEMLYSTWRKSIKKCYLCHVENVKNDMKFTYDYVKQTFENKGCELLTNNYTGNKQYLEYLCPNGHHTSITFDGFTRSDTFICGYCSKSYKYTIEDMRKEFINVGYTLLSTEYINAHCPLKFICENNHIHSIKWTDFSQGTRCGQCLNSRGIKICKDYFKSIDLPFTLEHKYPDCKNIKPLPFDLLVNNQFIIEYDGGQHFAPVDHFGGKSQFEKQKKHDHIKTTYCIHNKIPLLRISYKEIKIIPELINSFITTLKSHNKNTPLVHFSNNFLYKDQMMIYINHYDPSNDINELIKQNDEDYEKLQKEFNLLNSIKN